MIPNMSETVCRALSCGSHVSLSTDVLISESVTPQISTTWWCKFIIPTKQSQGNQIARGFLRWSRNSRKSLALPRYCEKVMKMHVVNYVYL